MRAYLVLFALLSACGRLADAVAPPTLTPVTRGAERNAMLTSPDFHQVLPQASTQRASLWDSGRQSLLGDRRAVKKGDILTVVIKINDKAEISNSTSRKRSGSEKMSISSLFGLPQGTSKVFPDGAGLDPAVGTSSASTSSGDGSVRRKEKLTLRVAATVTEVLPNGVLRIEGSQEIRVNYEIRELLVAGYIRPADISRQNEIPYDKIASARVSYGGRGLIFEAQQPRYGQRLTDKLLPF